MIGTWKSRKVREGREEEADMLCNDEDETWVLRTLV